MQTDQIITKVIVYALMAFVLGFFGWRIYYIINSYIKAKKKAEATKEFHQKLGEIINQAQNGKNQ